MPEPPPNDLNNNPHLRGANERFLAGGENPRLYRVLPAAIANRPLYSEIPANSTLDSFALRAEANYWAAGARYSGAVLGVTREDIARARVDPDTHSNDNIAYVATMINGANNQLDELQQAQPTMDLTDPPPPSVALAGPRGPLLDLSSFFW